MQIAPIKWRGCQNEAARQAQSAEQTRVTVMAKVTIFCVVAVLMAAAPISGAAGQTRFVAQKAATVGDGRTSDIALTEIAAIAIDRERNAYVAQGNEILKFDGTGKLLARIGRKGAGPGEYNSIFSMGWLGDTLWVSDPALGRITLLLKDKVAASFRVTFDGTQSPALALMRNRTVLARKYALNPQGDLLGGTLFLRHMNGREESLHPLFLKNKNVTLKLDDAMMNFTHPFDDSDLIAASPSGHITYVVNRATAQTSTDASFAITSFGPDGRKLRTTLKKYAPLVVKKSDYEKVIADYSIGLKNTQLFRSYPKEAAAAFRTAVPQPKFLTPWKNSIVSSDGQLWLQPSSLASIPVSEPIVWTVTDGTGRVAANVALPRRFRLKAASGNELWGYEVSDDDEITLVKYVLKKP